MNVDDALYSLVHDYPGGSESLAPRLGMSGAVLRNKVNPNCATHLPTVRDLRTGMALTGDLRPLHALADEYGHVLVKVAQGEGADDMAVLEVISALWSKNGDLGTAVHHALADGALSQAELSVIRDAAYHLQEQIASLLSRLNGMAEPGRAHG